MRLWLGLSEREVEIDWRGEGFLVFLPQSGTASTAAGNIVLPDGETNNAYVYELNPKDRGKDKEECREWSYKFVYPWDDPASNDCYESEVYLCLYRCHDGHWGLQIQPDYGPSTNHVLPEEVACGLEEEFDDLPKFIMIRGGAR